MFRKNQYDGIMSRGRKGDEDDFSFFNDLYEKTYAKENGNNDYNSEDFDLMKKMDSLEVKPGDYNDAFSDMFKRAEADLGISKAKYAGNPLNTSSKNKMEEIRQGKFMPPKGKAQAQAEDEKGWHKKVPILSDAVGGAIGGVGGAAKTFGEWDYKLDIKKAEGYLKKAEKAEKKGDTEKAEKYRAKYEKQMEIAEYWKQNSSDTADKMINYGNSYSTVDEEAGMLEKATKGAVGSLANMGVGAVIGGGNPLVGMGVTTYGQGKKEGQDLNLSEKDATKFAISNALIETGSELLLPGAKGIKSFLTTGSIKTAIKEAGKEGVGGFLKEISKEFGQEGLTEVANIVNEFRFEDQDGNSIAVNGGDFSSLEAGLKTLLEAGERVTTAGLSGAIMGGITQGGANVINNGKAGAEAEQQTQQNANNPNVEPAIITGTDGKFMAPKAVQDLNNALGFEAVTEADIMPANPEAPYVEKSINEAGQEVYITEDGNTVSAKLAEMVAEQTGQPVESLTQFTPEQTQARAEEAQAIAVNEEADATIGAIETSIQEEGLKATAKTLDKALKSGQITQEVYNNAVEYANAISNETQQGAAINNEVQQDLTRSDKNVDKTVENVDNSTKSAKHESTGVNAKQQKSTQANGKESVINTVSKNNETSSDVETFGTIEEQQADYDNALSKEEKKSYEAKAKKLDKVTKSKGFKAVFEGTNLKAVEKLTAKQDAVNELAKAIGREAVFYKADKKNAPNGFMADNTVFINGDYSGSAMAQVLGHETFHTLKNSHKETFNELIKYGRDNFTAKEMTDFLAKIDNKAEVNKLKNDPDLLVEEMLSEAFGNDFANKSFWKGLEKNNKTLFEKIKDVIATIFNRAKSFETDFLTEKHIEELRAEFEGIFGDLTQNAHYDSKFNQNEDPLSVEAPKKASSDRSIKKASEANYTHAENFNAVKETVKYFIEGRKNVFGSIDNTDVEMAFSQEFDYYKERYDLSDKQVADAINSQLKDMGINPIDFSYIWDYDGYSERQYKLENVEDDVKFATRKDKVKNITKHELTGINIRVGKNGFDFAEKILTGEKTIETRNSNSLNPYINQRVRVIRTGVAGQKAQILGEVTIGEPIIYNTEAEFELDIENHLVEKDSGFWINEGGIKYGYPMIDPVLYSESYDAEGYGIVARKNQPAPTNKKSKAFESNQIKSATGNNNDIRFSTRQTETPEFKKWFKDSKIVDDNGKPLKVHHGTTNGVFNVFDKKKLGENTNMTLSAQLGFNFADNKQTASNYANRKSGGDNKKVYSVYLSMQNPKVYEVDASKIEAMVEPLAVEASRLRKAYRDIAGYGSERADFINNLQEQGLSQDDIRQALSEEIAKRESDYKEASDKVQAIERDKDAWWKMRHEIEDKFNSDVTAFRNHLKAQGFDGVVIKNTEVDGTKKSPTINHYIAFEPNQIKSATENNGNFDESNDDIRFSTVGKDKNLMALHNISEENILKSIKLGGMVVPSIAITKDSIPFDFGSNSKITLIGDKNLIDPSNKKNEVYDSDIYSKRMPLMKTTIVNSLDIAMEALNTYNAKDEGVKSLASKLNAYGEDRTVKLLNNSDLFWKRMFKDNGINLDHLTYQDTFTELRKYPEINEAGKNLIREIAMKTDTKSTFKNKEGKEVQVTLENLLEYMKDDVVGSENAFNQSNGRIKAFGTKKFNSIEDIKASEDKLRNPDIVHAFENEFRALDNKMYNTLIEYSDAKNGNYADFGGASIDYISGKLTAKKALEENGFVNIPEEAVNLFKNTIDKLKSQPVNYFEAKPQRIVRFDEFKGAVVPEGTSEEVVKALKEAGVNEVKTYNKNNRQEVVSSFEDVKFSTRSTEETAKITVPLHNVADKVNDMQLRVGIKKLQGVKIDTNIDLVGTFRQAINTMSGDTESVKTKATVFSKVLQKEGIDKKQANAIAKYFANVVDVATRNAEEATPKAKNVITSASYKAKKEGGIKKQVGDGVSKMYSRLVDNTHAGKLVNDVFYTKARISKNSFSIGEHIMAEALVDKNGKKVGKSLKDLFADTIPEGKETDFMTYTLHKHNIARQVQGKPVFKEFTETQSQKIVAEYEAKNPDFKAKSEELTSWINNFMKTWAVDTGLISNEFHNVLKTLYPDYVPTNRSFAEHEELFGGGYGGKGFVDKTKPVKKATGSDRNIIDIQESIVQLVTKTVRTAKMNEVGQELVNAVRQNPEMQNLAEIVEEADATNPNIVRILENGEAVYVQIHNNQLLAMVEQVHTPEYGAITEVVKKFNGGVKALITSKNPLFAITNTLRDYQTYMVNSTEGNVFKRWGNIGKAIKLVQQDIAGKDMANTELGLYKAMGMGGSGIMAKDNKKTLSNITGKTAILNKDTGVIEGYKEFGKMKKGWNKFNESLEILTGSTETTFRLAEFLGAIEKGDTVENATLKAMEITVDFARGGDITKGVDAYVKYLNAGVQGLDRFGRQVKDKPVQTLTRSIAHIAAPALVLAAINGGDDEYEMLDDRTKDNNFLIPLKLFGGEEGQYIKLPKAREYGMVAMFAERIVYGRGFENLGRSIKENMAPPDAITDNIIFDLARAGDNEAKDFAGRYIVPKALQNLPAKEQYDDDTTVVAKWLGQLTGMSPKKIDYYLDGYSGIIGDMLQPMLTPSTYAVEGDATGKMLAPVRKKFVADNAYSSGSSSSYYDGLDTIQQMIDVEQRDMSTAEKRAYTSEAEAFKSYINNSYGKDITDLSKAIKDKSLSEAQKRELRKYRNEAMKMANKEINLFLKPRK